MVDFVRRAAELAEGTLPVYRAERTARHHRGLVHEQADVTYGHAKARQIIEQSVRGEGAAKNRGGPDQYRAAEGGEGRTGAVRILHRKNPHRCARLDPYGHGGAHGLPCTQQSARQLGFAFHAPPDTRSSAANLDEGAAAIEGHAASQSRRRVCTQNPCQVFTRASQLLAVTLCALVATGR
ncbi:hypothetical protein [Streptomyces sp. Wh19]|uniref:hypothetical protein n=1 Tax=Streptomyces sp. Wh19 TaxID=3076629 RepID=UPI0029585554|nr:hypothetical protein [Streptomyces sp. Wh19]MDV9194660.1 hypothetical protein [Streptomyces sp. Wh19]